MLKIILITVGIMSAQTPVFVMDSSTIYDINTIKTTYINPAIAADVFVTHYERAVVLKMNTLLEEVSSGRHPQWRANNIVKLAVEYVDMNKERKVRIEKINKSMEAYLEQPK